MKQPLIILTGPTAVGKTALSIRLAKAVGGEIISADSMQVYRHMDIGSAKVTSGGDGGSAPSPDRCAGARGRVQCGACLSRWQRRPWQSIAQPRTHPHRGRRNRILHPGPAVRHRLHGKRGGHVRSGRSWKPWPRTRAISGSTPCFRRSIPKRPGRSTPTTSSG